MSTGGRSEPLHPGPLWVAAAVLAVVLGAAHLSGVGPQAAREVARVTVEPVDARAPARDEAESVRYSAPFDVHGPTTLSVTLRGAGPASDGVTRALVSLVDEDGGDVREVTADPVASDAPVTLAEVPSGRFGVRILAYFAPRRDAARAPTFDVRVSVGGRSRLALTFAVLFLFAPPAIHTGWYVLHRRNARRGPPRTEGDLV